MMVFRLINGMLALDALCLRGIRIPQLRHSCFIWPVVPDDHFGELVHD